MSFLMYDGIIAAVLFLFGWRGWKKGFLLSLCGLIVAVAAYLGAGFIADTLDAPVADIIAPKLEEFIGESLFEHYDGTEVGTSLDVLREMGGLFEWAANSVGEAQDTAVGNAIDGMASQAAQFLSLKLAHSIIFALAFALLLVLLNLLVRALNLVAKLPVLHFFNGLGGGIVGLLKGVVILLVVLACLRLFTGIIPAQAEENTLLLKLFLRFDPLSTLLKA